MAKAIVGEGRKDVSKLCFHCVRINRDGNAVYPGHGSRINPWGNEDLCSCSRELIPSILWVSMFRITRYIRLEDLAEALLSLSTSLIPRLAFPSIFAFSHPPTSLFVMVFFAALLTQILLASLVFAAPSEGLTGRVARRRLDGARNGNVNKYLGPGPAHRPKPHGSGSGSQGSGSNSSSGDTQQSSNWAGAVLIAESAVGCNPTYSRLFLSLSPY